MRVRVLSKSPRFVRRVMARPIGRVDDTLTIEGANMSDTKPTGPASYFPSIEQKYGHPVAYWLDLLKARGEQKHMQLVAWLKSEHGMGHGHANALVAHHLKAGTDSKA
jgi:hypothetical protein